MLSLRVIRYFFLFLCVVFVLAWGSYKLTAFYLNRGHAVEVSHGDLQVVKTIAEINALAEKDPQAAKEFLNASYLYVLGEYWSAKKIAARAIPIFEKALSFDPDSSEIHYSLAREYLVVGRVDEGITLIKKAIDFNPKHRDARLLLGNLQVTAKRYAEARAVFQDLLKETPSDEEVLLTLVHLEIEEENTQKALLLLQNFLKEEPTSAPALFYLGRIQQMRGQTDAALDAYQKALDIHPSFSQAATAMALLYEDSGKKEKALELYSWLAAETGLSEFEKRAAQLYMDAGQLDLALEKFLSYEQKEPSDLNNKVKIALVYIENKKFPEAMVKLEEILKESPESDNIRFYLAAIYFQEKRFKEASKQYKAIDKSSKLYPEALRGYVATMKALGKTEDAWDFISDSLKKAETAGLETEYLYGIAGSYLEGVDRFSEAEMYISRGLERYPGSLQLIYQLATLQERQGKTEAALATGKLILAKDPQHVAALNFVGYLLADKGKDLSLAEKYIRKALTQRKNDPYILDSLGWVLYRRGKHTEALKTLQHAFTLKPEESVIAAHIGDVLLALGELQDALDYYEKALKLGPERENDKAELEGKRGRLKERLASGNCRLPECTNFVLDQRTPAQADRN